MEIPLLTRFSEGLRLFFSSRRLRWLMLIFVIGAIVATIMERTGAWWGSVGLGIVPLFLGGIFPTFFLIAAFLSLLGLQRFVADEESYLKSVTLFIPLLIASFALLIVLWIAFSLFLIVFVIIGFLGWIVFQAYLASSSSLRYAEIVEVVSRKGYVKFLFYFSNILCYAVIVVSAIGTIIFVNPAIVNPADPGFSLATLFLAAIGAFFAFGFNFLNGMIILKERNKQTADAIALLGIFVSFYSAYFLYNVLKGPDLGIDIVGIAVSMFFLLYALSNVGLTITSRADLDTRWKISRELGATFTFFLASGYMYVTTLFTVIITVDPTFAQAVGDLVKLLLFPGVAFLMELLYLRRAGRTPPAPEPEETPEVTVEEPPKPDVLEEEPAEEPYVNDEVRYEEEEIVDAPETEEEPVWTDSKDETEDLASDEDVGFDEDSES
ncbi:MAG: hypothetical protein JSW61_08120 [Candidatus Thorarchaeota archaeon]|nr:MAG: hypothetical protein JSW61_08120 [Candidatus Thorarchaeota archaeon]